ncbi:uncharacterized protein QC763_512170 [Podospora pseudopauciseta]|uniref:Secreted protein n=1 Tax=Podospora pseudopauciseta TaxID=2093780 RepID=A0ABR0H977_9PEZI|nr:hypothetical protein QC763_512170 [Podospora pseudopauciseta]
MLTKIFFAVGALLTQLVHGAAEPPVSSYSVVEVEWSLPVDPNKPNGAREFVTGTIEEAIAQMDAAHPGWSQTFTSNIQTVDPHALMARGSSPESQSVNCHLDSGKGAANCVDIRDGTRYLGSIDSPAPNNSPHSCGRVSCAYNSAIWWCNDNDSVKETTWKNMASSAWFLQDNCLYYERRTEKVSAQEFMKDEWNIYVTGDRC